MGVGLALLEDDVDWVELVDAVDREELVDSSELDELDVVVPLPTQSARSESAARLAKRPVSQLEPSQGFRACRVASVMLKPSVKDEQSMTPLS